MKGGTFQCQIQRLFRSFKDATYTPLSYGQNCLHLKF